MVGRIVEIEHDAALAESKGSPKERRFGVTVWRLGSGPFHARSLGEGGGEAGFAASWRLDLDDFCTEVRQYTAGCLAEGGGQVKDANPIERATHAESPFYVLSFGRSNLN
jgi:hypothetical protein